MTIHTNYLYPPENIIWRSAPTGFEHLKEKLVNPHRSESLKYFYVVPLFWAVILPVFIGLIKPTFYLIFHEIFFFLTLGLPVLAVLRIIVDFHLNNKQIFTSIFRNISFIPGFVHKTDLDIPSIPYMTISLVTINCFIFFVWPWSLMKQYTFLPYGVTTSFQIMLSCFISPFLHLDSDHLISNMLFLFVFGSVLESRLGFKRFLVAYVFFIFTSETLTLILLAIKINTSGIGSFSDYHALGASGATSGLMGIFAVRCYFARLTFSFSFLGLIGIPFQVPGVILIGIYFFAFDLFGSTQQFTRNLGVAYWAHVGGYLGGIILGYSLKLHVETIQEALTVKAKRLKANPLNRPELKEVNEEILSNEPSNEIALLDMFQSNRWRKEKAGEYFSRLMEICLDTNFQKAMAMFTEHYQDYASYLSDAVLFRLGAHHYKQHKLKEASWCLEIVMERECPLKIKAMLVLGKVYHELGNPAMAQRMFRRVLTESSDTSFQNEANNLLGGRRNCQQKIANMKENDCVLLGT